MVIVICGPWREWLICIEHSGRGTHCTHIGLYWTEPSQCHLPSPLIFCYRQHPAGLADYQKKPASAVNQNDVGSPKKAIIPAHPSANAANSDASFHHSAKKMMHVCHRTDVAEQHDLTSTSINGILDFLWSRLAFLYDILRNEVLWTWI